MRGWISLHIILLLFANIILKASCKGTSSLTFVIDDTSSMGDDIRQVRSSVNKIMDIVFNEKSSLIDNMVLVSFNDPDANLRIDTRDRASFARTLNAVTPHNIINNDCWEPSINGLLLALEKSNHGSFIYVFTDAPARDYRDGKYVMDLCQKKQSQIVFVLTGRCQYFGYEQQSFDVYFDIAAACNGHAFYVPKKDVNQVIHTIAVDIKGNKTVMVKRTIPPHVYTDIPFKIDEYTEYAVITASGANVHLEVKGPYANQERIMWNQNGKVIQLNSPKPGDYVATVMGESATSIVIVGRTNFFFNHGFSTLEPKSLGGTSPQPIAHTNVYLSVEVTDAKDAVNIKTAQILQMNGQLINELPLTWISGKFYATKPFVAPSEMFNIAIKGIIKASGKEIIRIAKIPVTPQAPPKKLPNNTSPIANIPEGASLEVDYETTVKLTCKVKAYPEPKITWYNGNGNIMPSQSSVVELPYEYISYMNIPKASQGDKYMCFAVNSVGKDSKTINVIVNDALTIHTVPAGVTNVIYGSEGIIKCDIRSHLPIDIHWYFTDERKATKREIVTSDQYSISADHTQLKIRKMDMDLAGRYTCKASLKHKKDIEKFLNTRVNVDGVAPAKVKGSPDIKVTKGKTAVIECVITAGVPKPKISWQFAAKSGSAFTPISGTDNVLRVSNAHNKNEGRYKCVAENILGKSEHVTTLHIQELPIIPTSKTTIYQATEGEAVLEIPCIANGIPKPVVSWKLNGRVITPDTKYSIKDGSLIIKDPKVSDTNSYTCEAKNEVGSASVTFKTYIRQAPKVSGVGVNTVKIGQPARITCEVLKGEPKPKITWQFMENPASKFVPVDGSGSTLNILHALKKNAGRYKCVAQNDVGSHEHITTLVVEFAPKIISETSTVVGVEGDLALRIPCEVDGTPKPDVTWKLNGVKITPSAKYSIEEKALVILKPNKNDSLSYTCEAKNYIGAVTAKIKAEVEDLLNDLGIKHNVYLLKGETKKLECEALTSKTQSVRWFMQGVEQKIDTPYLEIVKAVTDNDGNYTCRVSDKHGNVQTHNYIVDVGYQPILYAEATFNNWRGDVNDILSNCDSDAKPMAHVEWTFNGKVLTYSDVANIGSTYIWGHYTCNVSNVHGSVQRSFDVKSSSCLLNRNLRDAQYTPLLLSTEKTWPFLEITDHFALITQEEEIILSCPSHGTPNTFKIFPKLNELHATCNKQDEFLVNGKLYKLSDLQCTNSIQTSIVRKKEKCLTDTSELIRVGYNVAGFLETYEVCFDHAKNMPLYTRALVDRIDGSMSAAQNWFKYPGIGDGKPEKGYTCKNSLSSCCYRKTQLLNARDFNNQPAKLSTFIDPLNAVPVWRPCNTTKTNWENIDDMVITLLNTYPELIAWSGTHTLQEKDGAIIPRYLWKVLRLEDDVAYAIVHVNDRSPTDKDIKCSNACDSDGESWFKPNDKYTYCCSLTDFLEAFKLKETDIGESLNEALEKINKRA